MRSISFDKLRRLIGRKKDRNEPSFKRSESFKRISIRKSYLDRGKRRNKALIKTNDIVNNNDDNDTIQHVDVPVEIDNTSENKNIIIDDKTKTFDLDNNTKKLKNSNSSLHTTIAYDDWLNDINDTKINEILYNEDKLLSNDEEKNYDDDDDDISLSEKTEESLNLSDDFVASKLTSMSINSKSTLSDIESLTLADNGPPSVSVSLGRIWLGAALMPFPKVSSPSSIKSSISTSTSSLTSITTTTSIPFDTLTCTSTNKNRHRSLDSAWKEQNKSRYESAQITVSRTVSAPEKSQKNHQSTFNSLSTSISKIAHCNKSSNKLNKTGLSFFGKKKLSKSNKNSTTTIDNYDDNDDDDDDNKNLIIIDQDKLGFVLPEKRKLKKATHIWQEIRYFKNIDATFDVVVNNDSMNISSSLNNNNNITTKYNENKTFCNTINQQNQLYNTLASSSTCSKSSIVSTTTTTTNVLKISDFNEDKILSEKLRNILAQRPIWKPSINNDKKLQKKYTKKNQQNHNYLNDYYDNFYSSSQSINSISSSNKDTQLNYYRCLSTSGSSESDNDTFYEEKNFIIHKKNKRFNLPPKRRSLSRKKSKNSYQRQPVYLVRKYSLLKKQPRDITQKGYEKKKARILQQYASKHIGNRLVPGNTSSLLGPSCSVGNTGSIAEAAAKRGNRRLTRNESRYHSEVRQEAVQQALAAMQTRPKPSLPMPSKRTSVMARSPERERQESGESSSDEDSVVTEESPGTGGPTGTGLSDTSSTGSARDTPPPPRPPARRPPPADITDIAEYTPHAYCNIQPPDVTHTTTQSRRPGADRVNRYHVVDENNTGTTGRWKVSAKIQQLLNTLKRPKKRPLPEFYEDDDIELEIAANPKDPNAPKPEGGIMTSAIGEQLSVPSGLPRSLEAAIQRYGSATYKAPAATVLDPNGKLFVTLTYGKLLSRSYKIAYTLLNRALTRTVGECCLKPGDRIALVYPNNDPISFMCAFYGCLQAGIVPVPIEVPLTRRDAGSQQIGFLLGSCGVQVALTSEACLKGLPKTTAGDVVAFKGWPKLHWFVTEHLGKIPKDWMPQPRLTDETPAYIEYSTDKDGSVMGVTVTRSAMLANCRSLTMACGYTEGENAVCVLDFKREVGLWHSTLTSILNGMHVIFIPYALMKVNPASWMQMITKHRASVAVVKSRDLHWGLLATKDHKDISLASLRLLLVADGANPWSLSSCDQFLSVFQPKGLRPDAVCPCASSSEALTVSVRRPGRAGVNATGRGVLSMSGLSYGVVRVDQENSLTSLTLQDCGQVMPGSVVVVVKMEGQPLICKTDEVGEICVNSTATGSQYWGLQGLTNNTFKVIPQQSDGTPIAGTGDTEYVRSGLLGFLGPGNLIFVCGSRDGLMTVTGRKHNADDIIATVLAVEPMKFIYRGRIAVFSVRVLRDERICVVAEQRPDCSEEESFQWMSRVLQAVDSIHAVGIYCLALVPPNYLPKTPLGGIHLSETKRRFLEGALHPANVLLCPHTCVTNLPKPREIHSAGDSVSDVGPASVMVGNIVQGNRLASAQGRDLGVLDEDSDNAKKYQFISEILRWRAMSTSDHVIFTLLNAKGVVTTSLSCSQLHKKAEKIGNLLLDKGRINTGDHVALLFPPGTDLICAFYGCLYVGAVPVTIRPPHPQNLQTTLPTVRMIVDVSKSVLVLTNQNMVRLLKSKEANNVVEIKSWPTILDMDDMPKKKLPVMYRAPTAEMLAYLDFSVSTTGMLAGIKMSHAAVTSLCRAMKLACELYPSRHIALCLDPYSGLGFALWCLSSIYSGHHSILIPPSEVEANPALWLSAVSQSRVRDTFCSYGVMELCTKGLGSSVHTLKTRGVSLACVRTCVVVAEERPRIALTTSFSKLFSALGLSPRAVSTSFGCRVNTAICLQGASSPEPSTVYVDLRALRNDRVSLVERGSPHSLCLMESGKLLPGVKVIIANPETKGQCGDSHLGEIWVQSSHNASGYFTIYGDESDYADHFNARLVTGNTGEVYARTGYLGFLRRTECVQQSAVGGDQLIPGAPPITTDNISISDLDISAPGDAELHDAVFVVGALDEAILLRGMKYHPIDIENSVMRCHKKIAECAVFTWTNLLVVVVELNGSESEALDLVALVTSAVLEEHHLVVGVVVVVDPGVVPINSRGEKQRQHLRDGFLADQLDPIYVAYNM
ncbi:disco-interacting protein 2 isoform X4 [Aphidius gifuensis]|uniref:disco-interacting protein 2 isoform X4 n=1 Tax=Aphidius gifuensis TaxID=684658 RepID=UPI001CDB5FDA|nr:disco-interacting protein 2 isoform X4 [Aphidius gifuensis]